MYDFRIGDYVETIYGDIGCIVDFCDCSFCKKRGYNEPIVKYTNKDDLSYITIHDRDSGFRIYVQIGKYIFSDVKEDVDPTKYIVSETESGYCYECL